MKRSEGKAIQIQHGDWEMAKRGVKTCTSRYGDRTAEYPVGEIFDFTSNETGEVLKIKITKVVRSRLKDVTSEEAKAIGDYSWADHVADVYGIYAVKLGREVNENTIFSLVHFEIA